MRVRVVCTLVCVRAGAWDYTPLRVDLGLPGDPVGVSGEATVRASHTVRLSVWMVRVPAWPGDRDAHACMGAGSRAPGWVCTFPCGD